MALFEAEDLDVSYEAKQKGQDPSDDSRKIHLQHITFALEEGCIYDLVGPSGNGKSMLFRTCALMMERQGGLMRLEGKSDSSFAPCEWRRDVCLVPQQPSLVPGTIRENLLLPWTLKVNAHVPTPSDRNLEELLQAAQLDMDLDHSALKLSGGQAARVAMLRALATHPKVLLLDEIDAALDEEASKAMSELTKRAVEQGSTCLRIRHRASDGLASSTFFLHDGILETKPSDISKKEVT